MAVSPKIYLWYQRKLIYSFTVKTNEQIEKIIFNTIRSKPPWVLELFLLPKYLLMDQKLISCTGEKGILDCISTFLPDGLYRFSCAPAVN